MMADGTRGLGDPGEQRRVAPRSPRAALEPEFMADLSRPSRRARHPLVIAGNAIFTIILIAALAGGLAYSVGKGRIDAPGPLENDKVVNIPRGLGLRDIADVLAREGVIDQPWVFIGGVVVLKAREDLKYGEYKFTKNITLRDAIETIVSGKVIQHAVTIPEGLTSEQIVARLVEVDFLAGNIREIPKEGTLLPETYNFPRGTTREQAIQRMQQAQKRVLQEVWERRSADVPVKTVEQLVTLASIVEKETGKPDERSRVAAVFVNRLKSAHAAAIRPDHHLRAGRRQGHARPPDHAKSEIEQPTPYNTYVIEGLPPGPDRQSGPRLARGGRQSGAHQGALLRRRRHRRARLRRKPPAAPAERRAAAPVRAAGAHQHAAGDCDPVHAADDARCVTPAPGPAKTAPKKQAKQKQPQ